MSEEIYEEIIKQKNVKIFARNKNFSGGHKKGFKH